MVVQTFPEDPHSGDIDSKSWSERLAASEQIVQSQARIKEIWEKKVREQVAEVQHTRSAILVDSFGIFLTELASILQQENPSPERLSESAMAKIHGGNRALFQGYSLSQLLLEFSVVREVLSEELHKYGVLTYGVRSIIDKSIDKSISSAVMEFERIQNENIKIALDHAESSNRDLEQLAFVAAHDLNSPLATISSLVDLLVEQVGDSVSSEGHEYINYIKETLLRMRSLIGNLLEYARLTKKKKLFQMVSLNEILKASLQNLKNEIEKSHAKVISIALPSVLGDPDMLVQVFQNLIANSIKYRGSQPPEIQINALERDPENWLVIVKDNGVGFEDKEKEDIFSLYKRAQDKSDIPGAGIGLATCRKVIELHGGKIWAESASGKGSTFYFILPKKNIDNLH